MAKTRIVIIAHLDDLGRDEHKGSAKSFPLPARDPGRQRKDGDPLTGIPSQACDLLSDAVALVLAHGHAPGGDATAELLDDVFLVAPLVGLVDDLGGSHLRREVGEDGPVAVLVAKVDLPLAMLDALTAQGQAVVGIFTIGLPEDLGDPLAGLAQLLVVPLASAATSSVRPLLSRLVSGLL